MSLGCAPVLAIAIAAGVIVTPHPTSGDDPSPVIHSEPSPPPPSPAEKPATRRAENVRRVTGSASFYEYVRGQGAAGPRLRRWLGAHWRGMVVTVRSARHRPIRVRLTDSCACYGTRLIDLDPRDFAHLGELRRGVITVTVTR